MVLCSDEHERVFNARHVVSWRPYSNVLKPDSGNVLFTTSSGDTWRCQPYITLGEFEAILKLCFDEI